ncbi:hypothetical protein PoHVEF18_002577 [Penicillium ochrochloron]
MLLNPFRPCEGSPTYQEEYRGNYIPKVIEREYGLQVVAPDTPYVAAAGRNALYFLDTRFDPETAKHIKEQIEKASVPNLEEYISIDEVLATAEIKNSVTGETTFVFDPPYARVLNLPNSTPITPISNAPPMSYSYSKWFKKGVDPGTIISLNKPRPSQWKIMEKLNEHDFHVHKGEHDD